MIEVNGLGKTYRVAVKAQGLAASVRSLFSPTYKEVHAVTEVSFRITPGELVGFIGPNGAGKTTTLKMLSGLLHPSRGTVKVLGYTPHDRNEQYLKQISLIMGQRNQLWWDLPTVETFRLNKDIYGVDEKSYRETVGELTEILEVKDVLTQPVRSLSLGQRMKCEFIAALIHRPKILFLDEPTIGLDIFMQKKVRQFIKEYNAKYKATVILTSHYMDDVRELCDRIIMIDRGRLVYDGRLADLVRTYANHKILVPIFNSPVTREELAQFATVVSFSYPKAVLNVPRGNASEIAAKLLHKYDIDDLDINEPELADVVGMVFAKSKKERKP